MAIPKKKWVKRPVSSECKQWAKSQGHNDLLSTIIAGRFTSDELLEDVFNSKFSDMDQPEGLPDIKVATDRIADAIINGEVIALETDHDCDGVTSHAVLKEVLIEYLKHPKDKVRSFIGHRLEEGYGLSHSVAMRIINDEFKPTLVITADNGSSDEPRIALLKSHGIETIVTDHHEIPHEGIPLSALAVISPAREDSIYPDKLIAGCMVACLLMASVCRELVRRKHFEVNPPSVTNVFDYVALGTVADCVSMSRSKNNRMIVQHGLKIINKGLRPCWRAIKPYASKEKDVTAETLGFAIGPRINARGRLDEAMAGVNFLLAKEDNEAAEYAKLLDNENIERKKIESELKLNAIIEAMTQVDAGKLSIVIYLPDGHAGVHGIVASRITEAFGRPSIIISPKKNEPDVVSASARGIANFNVRGALQETANNDPDLLIKFGGHIGAAGLSLRKENIEKFINAYEDATKLQISQADVGPIIFSDGEIKVDLMTLELLKTFKVLEPFGREMDSPSFESNFYVKMIKKIGKDGATIKAVLQIGEKVFDAVWFNASTKDEAIENFHVQAGQTRRFLFKMDENVYNERSTLQLMIQDVL